MNNEGRRFVDNSRAVESPLSTNPLGKSCQSRLPVGKTSHELAIAPQRCGRIEMRPSRSITQCVEGRLRPARRSGPTASAPRAGKSGQSRAEGRPLHGRADRRGVPRRHVLRRRRGEHLVLRRLFRLTAPTHSGTITAWIPARRRSCICRPVRDRPLARQRRRQE